MDVGDAIAAFVAIIGLGALGWQVFVYRQNRRSQVRLDIPRIENRPIMVSLGGPSNLPQRDVLVVKLTNTGPVTFTVDSLKVERPVPYEARLVRMNPAGDDLLAPGEACEYSLSMSSIEDDDADRTHPIRFRVALTSGDVFVTDDVPLTWPLSDPPEPPRLKRE